MHMLIQQIMQYTSGKTRIGGFGADIMKTNIIHIKFPNQAEKGGQLQRLILIEKIFLHSYKRLLKKATHLTNASYFSLA